MVHFIRKFCNKIIFPDSFQEEHENNGIKVLSITLITWKVGIWWWTECRDFPLLLLLFLCDLVIWDEEAGEWRILASLFCLVLQKFFTSLSVLPGRYEAIVAHLFPNLPCKSITTLSSSTENLHPLKMKQQQQQKSTNRCYMCKIIWISHKIIYKISIKIQRLRHT